MSASAATYTDGHLSKSMDMKPLPAADVEVVVAQAAIAEARGGIATGSATAEPVSLPRAAMELSTEAKRVMLGAVLSAFAVTSFLSVMVVKSATVFPTGPLTLVQMCFFTLSHTAVLMRIVVAADLWPETASTAFTTYVNASSEIAATLLLFFVCDRTTIIPRRQKNYDKDFFWLIVVAFAVAGAFTIKKIPKRAASSAAAKPVATAALPGEVTDERTLDGAIAPPSAEMALLQRGEVGSGLVASQSASEPNLLMNRYQTDEWKGWMQMLFLWYHYYHNTGLYNVIRVFIAAYVWMTGFGNFTYYYKREDFSLNRFFSMMWRLNMFVVCVCGILRNEYMLYYICPLHTFFTLTVYVMVLIVRGLNRNGGVLALKLALTTALCFLLWDSAFSQSLFRVVFYPIEFLIRYDDPYQPDRDIYQEWFFRSFLDHYIWIVGMLVAYYYPSLDRWVRRLDDSGRGSGRTRMLLIKWAIGGVCCVALVMNYFVVIQLPKKEYNAIHPYTSVVPLTAFLVLRNLSQRVRGVYIELFEWFGKVTLETYICQYHIWMATTGINGSPRELLHIIPGDYPMCDFLLGSIVMFFISHRVGLATDVTKQMFFPPKASNQVLCINLLTAVAVCVALIAAHGAWQAFALS